MLKSKLYPQLFLFLIFIIFLSGCGGIIKTKKETARVLTTEKASKDQLLGEINRFAKVNSIHAKMDLSFEDTAYADTGIAEKYRTADSDIIVQRPSNIFLKVQIPLIKSDVAQMTSDGDKFRVAILRDDDGGKFKKFVSGSNKADYSKLQDSVNKIKDSSMQQKVNVFANIRPQHFTEALLVRPTDAEHTYLQSEIVQDEVDPTARKNSPIARVLRGYYLLDELAKNANGDLTVMRRFWFDRVGGIRLARQQIFGADGSIESDIVYGKEGNLSDDPDYRNLPTRVEVTRPKEKYKISLTYQAPEGVLLGKTYNQDVFVLKNSWNLPEVDLDKQLQLANQGQKTSFEQNANASAQ